MGRVSLATVIGLIFAVWGTYIGAQLFSDNSTMTHLATGRLILDEGMPHSDPYSFTAMGEPWVVQSWLPAVAFAALERWFGPGGPHLLTSLLCGGLGAIAWLLTAPARSLVTRLVLALLALLVGAFLWAERPLLVGLVGIGLLLLARERPVPAWVFLPFFWLWVNAHGSFPLGLVLIVLFWVGARLDGQPSDRARSLLGWSLAGCAAGLISPLGFRVLTFPVALLGRQDALEGVVEWQSPDFSDFWARVFLVQVLLAVVALVRRPSYRDALPLVVFLAAALVASRNVAVASLILLPGTARGFSDFGTITGRNVRGLVPAAAAALLGVLALLLVWSSVTGPGWTLQGYPVAALSWADDRGLVDDEQRVATQDFVGNFIESVWGTEVPVFMDDRFDMFPSDVLADYRRLASGDPGWQSVLERHDIDTVVWNSTGATAGLLTENPDWQVTFQDGSWIVLEHRPS